MSLTSHRRRPMAMVACLLLLGAIGEPVAGLPDGVGIVLLEVPEQRVDDPRANLYIIDHMIPGASITRTVGVSNGTDEALSIVMKSVPSSIDDGWVIDGEDDVARASALADWVTLEPAEFTVAPQSVVEVKATIAVPPGTTAGERYATLVAEPPAVDAGVGISSIGRVGMRLYISIGGDEPESDFEIDTLIASRTPSGEPSVEVGVLNTGGRAIDVNGELDLVSADGVITAGPFPSPLASTLAPGTRGSVVVPLPESLDAGPWEVTATMRSGLLERVAEATITFPEPGETADPAESETIGGTDAEGNDISDEIRNQRRILLPLAAILILLAIVALYLLLLWKRREEDEDEDDEDEPVAAGARSAAGEDEGS